MSMSISIPARYMKFLPEPPSTIHHHQSQSNRQLQSGHSRGRGGRICFLAEAWKATICDTPAALRFTSGARIADKQDCRSRGDWRAIEAMAISGGIVKEKSSTHTHTQGRHNTEQEKSIAKDVRTSKLEQPRKGESGYAVITLWAM